MDICYTLLLLLFVSWLDESTGQSSAFLMPVNIFIHAWFDKSSYPLAINILDEMLSAISTSAPLQLCDVRVHVCVGASNQSALQRQYLDELTFLHNTVDVKIVDVSHLGIYEWATLQYLEIFVSDPLQQESFVLYMHTKGTSLTKQQLDRAIIATDREHFYHFLIKNAHVCLEALAVHGYSTCGVDKSMSAEMYTDNGAINMTTLLYNGNYWWATSEWLKTRAHVFRGDSGDRSGANQEILHGGRGSKTMAEAFLLWGVSQEQSQRYHYCVYHNHHDG